MSAAGAMVGVMIGRNLVLLQEGCAASEAAWRPLADRGLRFDREPAGPLVPVAGGRPVARGSIDGHACEVRVRSDAVHYAETDVTVTPALPIPFRLGVWGSRGGALGAIRDWVHGDVRVGDAAFDERFLVTSSPEEAAAEALGPVQRERLSQLAAGTFAGLVADPERVVVTFSGVQLHAGLLLLALDLALEVARSP